MGHKVNPIGFRLGVVKGWQSRWYAERDYKNLLAEDFKLRKVINKELSNASVARIEIERAAANQVTVTIYTAKPGIVIGKSGEKVDKLRARLEAETKKRVRLNIVEIRQPELDAILVARSIAEQLEKRVSFRRAMKQAVQKTMRANAKGIRIVIGGRLGGAEIARSEKEVEGKIPLHTLRADIDYGLAEANTTFGVIGIKVWIYKGDILPEKRRESLEMQQEMGTTPREGAERRGERRRLEGGAPRGERGERAPRGERPQGERAPRGERTPRGERGGRPQGERPQRGQGERPQGERPARAPRAQGERPARQGQGERAPRAGRTERTGQAPASGESQTQAATVQEATATQASAEAQVPALPPAPQVAELPPAPASEALPAAPAEGESATHSESE